MSAGYGDKWRYYIGDDQIIGEVQCEEPIVPAASVDTTEG
jgi:hypothetical protein